MNDFRTRFSRNLGDFSQLFVPGENIPNYSLRTHLDPPSGVILCIGCSFTKYCASEVKSQWPYWVLQLLKNVHVYNEGCPSSGSWYHLEMAHLCRLRPDLVIYQLMGVNRNPSNEIENQLLAHMRQNSDCHKDRMHELLLQILRRRYSEADDHSMARKGLGKAYLPGNEFFNELNSDLEIIQEIKNIYQCPFIFLANNNGYPYYDRAASAFKKIKDACASEDSLLITSFSGLQTAEDDFHPNEMRAKLTGFEVVCFLKKNKQYYKFI